MCVCLCKFSTSHFVSWAAGSLLLGPWLTVGELQNNSGFPSNNEQQTGKKHVKKLSYFELVMSGFDRAGVNFTDWFSYHRLSVVACGRVLCWLACQISW